MSGRAVLAAVVAGVLAGALSAAVQAEDSAAPPPAAVARPQPATVPPPRDPSRLPDGRYDAARVHYRVHGARIAARAPDPRGGPDWAVRVFDAERLALRRPARSLDGARVVGRVRCAQLGRLQHGVFGWVYVHGRFRRAGTEDQLMHCASRRRPRPAARLQTTLALEDPAAPRFAATVVWGLAPGARTVRVAGVPGADGPATVGRGAFLRVGPPGARAGHDARVQIGTRTLLLNPVLSVRRGSRLVRFPTILPGSERVEARAPDPAGGPGYGVATAESREGRRCLVGAGRVVGDRLGGVDLRLGLFTDHTVLPLACGAVRPPQSRACDLSTGFTSVDHPDGDDAFVRAARVERRLLPGRTMVTARCHPDVERVTLQTPRDLRTLVPSPVGRVVLAVYDGTFPGGEVVLTAHLRGGGTRTRRMPLG